MPHIAANLLYYFRVQPNFFLVIARIAFGASEAGGATTGGVGVFADAQDLRDLRDGQDVHLRARFPRAEPPPEPADVLELLRNVLLLQFCAVFCSVRLRAVLKQNLLQMRTMTEMFGVVATDDAVPRGGDIHRRNVRHLAGEMQVVVGCAPLLKFQIPEAADTTAREPFFHVIEMPLRHLPVAGELLRVGECEEKGQLRDIAVMRIPLQTPARGVREFRDAPSFGGQRAYVRFVLPERNRNPRVFFLQSRIRRDRRSDVGRHFVQPKAARGGGYGFS